MSPPRTSIMCTIGNSSGSCLGFRQQNVVSSNRTAHGLFTASSEAAGTSSMRIIKWPHSLPSLRACFWPMSKDYLGLFWLFWGMINEGSHALLVSSVGFLRDLDMAVLCSGRRCLDFCHTRSYQRLIMGATRGIFAFSGFLLLS